MKQIRKLHLHRMRPSNKEEKVFFEMEEANKEAEDKEVKEVKEVKDLNLTNDEPLIVDVGKRPAQYNTANQ